MITPQHRSFFFTSHSPAETLRFASRIATYAQPGDIYCLEGAVGAGKTAFAQGFARGLGIAEVVTSPSFPIIQEYAHDPPFYHMDFYRLSASNDLLEIGADELFLGSGISMIEWPDRAAGLLPANIITIHLDIGSGTERRVSVFADPERIQEIVYVAS